MSNRFSKHGTFRMCGPAGTTLKPVSVAEVDHCRPAQPAPAAGPDIVNDYEKHRREGYQPLGSYFAFRDIRAPRRIIIRTERPR